MSYPVRFRFQEGFSTLKALIQSLERGENYYWDDVGNSWVDGSISIPASCYKTLTESASPDKGVYTGTFTNLSPVKGCTYRIWVVDSEEGAGGFYHNSDEIFPSDVDTAKTIVNSVQKRLRLPQSTDFTDANAKLILDFVNDAYYSLITNSGVLQQLRAFGKFTTHNGGGLVYPILPINKQSVERLVSIRPYNLGTVTPSTLQYLSPEQLKEKKEELGVDYSAIRPVYYTIKQISQKFPSIEFFPAPDFFYPFEYEAILRPEKLSLVTDVPFLNSDLITYGATILAKKDSGLDPSSESELYSQLLNTVYKDQDFLVNEIDC